MNVQSDLPLNQSHSILAIEPRRVRFDHDGLDKARFFGDNIISSAFYVALSTTFPAGEAEFIRSVKLFEDKISDAKLLAEVQAFAAQESHHGLQHRRLNKRLAEVGFPVLKVEQLIDQVLSKRATDWSAERRLRRTVAAEHFTATMAHQALTMPHTLDAGPESFKKLMLWHSIEEIEHKSVTFDVYQHCVGDMGALRRHYMHFAFFEFPMKMWMLTRMLLKDGGFKVTWKERREFLGLLFGRKGIFSSMWRQYGAFLKRDFHPWQHDDSHLVGEWQSVLATHFVGRSD